MEEQSGKWTGIMLAIIAATLWGVSGTLVQFLFEKRGINIAWLVTARLLVSGTILLVFSGVRKDPGLWAIWKNRKDSIQLILFSILGMLAVQYTYFAAIKHSNAATGTILQYIGPVLITIYFVIKNRKWPAPTEYMAIFLAVSGTFLLVTHGSIQQLSISGWALFWGLASAVSLAYYNIQPASLLKKYSSSVIIGWGMLVGGIAISFVKPVWQIEGIWDTYTFAYTAFIILLGSLVAFYIYMIAIRMIGAQTTSLLASAEPLSSTLLAVIWLQVPFGKMDWLGTLFILTTIFLLAKKKKATINEAVLLTENS